MIEKATPESIVDEPAEPTVPTSITELEEAAADLAVAETEDPSDPIELVRRRLDIDDRLPDVSIAASLAQIATRGDARERWLAAFGSPLGKFLAKRGGDLNATLDVLLGLVPRHNG